MALATPDGKSAGNGAIIRSSEPVTLLGGGELGPGDLDEALSLAPVLVAADGAAQAALAAGRMPDAVIGDFDSLGAARERIAADRLHHVEEQDSTDFEKCLRNIDAPLILAAGFTGRRIDHELAVYNALVRHGGRRCVVIGSRDIVFHAAPMLRLELEAATRVSLFPLMAVRGRSEGLHWPVEGIDFAPGGRIGTSNRATGPVVLAMEGPGMLVILPRSALEPAIAGLLRG